MSTYCYIACKDCHELLHIKDSDTDIHANPKRLGQFLEKHHLHNLSYLTEDDPIEDCFPADLWPRFVLQGDGYWSRGTFHPNT